MTQFIHKKSLGQNFLKNNEVIAQIIDLSHITSEDVIIEIGPGQGILTEALAQRAGKVIAIELDDRLIPDLQKRFAIYDNVVIVHDDILKMNYDEFVLAHNVRSFAYKVVANIPYYITAPIIRLFLEQSCMPQSLTLMVQKEVAERLCAQPGEMSIIAVAAQYYADVTYGFTVSRNNFEPVPAVDSAIVTLTVREKQLQNNDMDENFFRTVKIGFSARRKTLCNNIANGFHMSKDAVVEMLQNIGLSENVRAQELSITQWQSLTQKLHQ
jgi:16S rRNA (adenine1518-N6/adenine1519-N6)-dimethyltransferase